MTEQETKIIVTIAEALPQLTDFEKGYLLGLAESKTKHKISDEEEVLTLEA